MPSSRWLFGKAQPGVIERGPKQVSHHVRLLFGYLKPPENMLVN